MKQQLWSEEVRTREEGRTMRAAAEITVCCSMSDSNETVQCNGPCASACCSLSKCSRQKQQLQITSFHYYYPLFSSPFVEPTLSIAERTAASAVLIFITFYRFVQCSKFGSSVKRRKCDALNKQNNSMQRMAGTAKKNTTNVFIWERTIQEHWRSSFDRDYLFVIEFCESGINTNLLIWMHGHRRAHAIDCSKWRHNV